MRPFQTAPLQLKFAADDALGSFTGYASTFGGDPDSHGDLIAPGAFAASLARHSAAGTRPALLWQHDQANPVGVWNSFEEDAQGLLSSGRLTLDVPQAKAAHALAKDGALALSIGYTVPPGGAELVNGARLLKQIDLVEVSLVAIAANPNARIVSVKSAFDPSNPNPRDFERAHVMCWGSLLAKPSGLCRAAGTDLFAMNSPTTAKNWPVSRPPCRTSPRPFKGARKLHVT